MARKGIEWVVRNCGCEAQVRKDDRTGLRYVMGLSRYCGYAGSLLDDLGRHKVDSPEAVRVQASINLHVIGWQ